MQQNRSAAQPCCEACVDIQSHGTGHGHAPLEWTQGQTQLVDTKAPTGGRSPRLIYCTAKRLFLLSWRTVPLAYIWRIAECPKRKQTRRASTQPLLQGMLKKAVTHSVPHHCAGCHINTSLRSNHLVSSTAALLQQYETLVQCDHCPGTVSLPAGHTMAWDIQACHCIPERCVRCMSTMRF